MEVDYLIIGQGLAGSALAMALLDLNASVLVVDREDLHSASRVAAGLITTVAGKGMNPSWRQSAYLPEAMAYYRGLERVSGESLFHEMDTLRLFDSEKQQRKFFNKRELLEQWVEDAKEVDFEGWKSDYGGFLMKRGGWLDTNKYLKVIRNLLGESYRIADFSEQDLKYEIGNLTWRDVNVKRVIFCQGAAGLSTKNGNENESLFGYIKHRSSKGEILTVSIADADEGKIINRNGWMIPIGEGQWRCGANYNWQDLTEGGTAPGREHVEGQIRGLTNRSFEVVDHTSGVRPIIRKSQPYVGHHPKCPEVSFFNGLGSKGVTTAPSVAKHFAEHLVHGAEIDPELNLKLCGIEEDNV